MIVKLDWVYRARALRRAQCSASLGPYWRLRALSVREWCYGIWSLQHWCLRARLKVSRFVECGGTVRAQRRALLISAVANANIGKIVF